MADFDEPVNIRGGNDLSVYNDAGTRTVQITSDGALGLKGALAISGGSGLSIYDSEGTRTVDLTGDGALGLRGNLAIEGGHDLSLYSDNGDRTAQLTAQGRLGLGGPGFDGGIDVTSATGEYAVTISGASGDIVLQGADCAELFSSIAEPIEPGTVLVVGDDELLRPSDASYDRRVAGIVTGAGGLRPGVMLGSVVGGQHRVAVALMGTAYCKVDARYGAIETGDLLTSSPSLGFAMKAADPARSFGAVIGKALRAHSQGMGLIPVLVSLQ